MILQEPTHKIFHNLDPNWCLREAKRITQTIPMFERSNTSGKFYRTYHCWHFHRDSNEPLIQKFLELCEQQREIFTATYHRPLEIDFLILAHTPDSSQEMCIYHKDGHYFDGQMHLTILGNANIHVLHDTQFEPSPTEPVNLASGELIRVPNGTFWFLNSTRFTHKILPSTGERFELCAAVNYRKDLVHSMMRAVSEKPSRHLELIDEQFIEYRKGLIRAQLKATIERRASNSGVAEFSHEIDEQQIQP